MCGKIRMAKKRLAKNSTHSKPGVPVPVVVVVVAIRHSTEKVVIEELSLLEEVSTAIKISL